MPAAAPAAPAVPARRGARARGVRHCANQGGRSAARQGCHPPRHRLPHRLHKAGKQPCCGAAGPRAENLCAWVRGGSPLQLARARRGRNRGRARGRYRPLARSRSPLKHPPQATKPQQRPRRPRQPRRRKHWRLQAPHHLPPQQNAHQPPPQQTRASAGGKRQLQAPVRATAAQRLLQQHPGSSRGERRALGAARRLHERAQGPCTGRARRAERAQR